MDAQTRQVVEKLSRELVAQRQELAALKRAQRAPQLAYSSLEEGQSLEVRDETGAVRGRWGWVNGTVAVTTEGGDPVSAPTAPTVTPSLGGLAITWDGTLADPDEAIPADFDHMAVHVSASAGFTPSAATYQGTIRRAGDGGMLPVVPLPYVPHYVVLVPVTTGGIQGDPSAEVSATPLQTSGIDLEADSIDAVHIKTGAVEAAKLEAVLALVTTIIAGIPGAARVEMDQDGLRGYNELNELIFAIDSAGNAVFSGDIIASEITGSRMVIGAAPGNVGVIEDAAGVVRTRVTSSGGQRAQIAATGSGAEFTAWADPLTPSPIGGMVAQTGIVALTLQSVAGDSSEPYAQLSADSGEAAGGWVSSFTGSSVVIRALPDFASIRLTAPAAVDPDDAQGPGFVFTQRATGDIAAVSMQGPEWGDNTGPEYQRRAVLFVEGARPERPWTRIAQGARRYLFTGETVAGVYDTSNDGVVELSPTHSILSAAHQPHESALITPPVWTSPTTGSFVDFTSGQWAPITWRTGWSGWVEVTIHCSGLNPASDASSLAVGCRLSGGSTVAAALDRCAYIRSIGQGIGSARVASITFPLQLAGVSDYTLTPQYRLSSWNATAGRAAFMDTALANRITIRNLT